MYIGQGYIKAKAENKGGNVVLPFTPAQEEEEEEEKLKTI